MYFIKLGVDSSINSPGVPVEVSVVGRRGHKYNRSTMGPTLLRTPQWCPFFMPHSLATEEAGLQAEE